MASFNVISPNLSQSNIKEYASMLELNKTKIKRGVIKSLLDNYAIKLKTIEENKPIFETQINKVLANHTIQNNSKHILIFVVKLLNLNNNFMFIINKDKLFLFSDISQHQLLTNIILNQYVDNIIKYTTPLEFSAKNNFISMNSSLKVSI